MAASLLSYLRTPAIGLSGLVALASGLLYVKQNELIYPRNLPLGARDESKLPRPSQFGIQDHEDLRLPTPDGETLCAIFIRPSNKAQRKDLTILMFHGNAGSIQHRLPIARALEYNLNCNILMMEYRGYGLSTGTPDERGLMIDAQTGLDYIVQREDTRDTMIVVYGQSLGGAVATQLVANNQHQRRVRGLILENTFTSMRKLIPSVIPVAKYLAPLCHQTWYSDEALVKIKDIPVLFLSGRKDEIIPCSHMDELYRMCRTPVKVWREFANGTHNESVVQPNYFVNIADFVKEYVLKEK